LERYPLHRKRKEKKTVAIIIEGGIWKASSLRKIGEEPKM
jgi:hypothetical protein